MGEISKNTNPGVYIGIPTYDGKEHNLTVAGLVQVARYCGEKRLSIAVDVIPGDCFISKARNTLAHRFLTHTNWQDLIFVDADVGFDLAGFAALMKSDAEIVMGLYRVKDDKLKFPALLHEPITPHPTDPRLVKLQYGPGGFMRVKRVVFEKMIQKWPEEYYYAGESQTDDNRMYDFFPSGRVGHQFVGEDISFCQRAQACGFDIWAVQDVPLTHTGPKTYDASWRVLHEVKETQEAAA